MRLGKEHIRELFWAILCVALLALIFSLNAQKNQAEQEKRQMAEQVQYIQSQLETVSDQLAEATLKVEEQKHFEEQVLRLYKSQQISRGSNRPRIVASYRMMATAYGNSELNGGSGDGLVATPGRSPVEGRTIAVDPSVIPLGSKVLVICPSRPDVNGVYLAEDVGGDIVGGRIDIYFDDMYTNEREANKRMLAFGTRDVIIHVLKD